MAILDGANGINKVRESDKVTIYSSTDNLYFVAVKNGDFNGKIYPVVDLNKNDYSDLDKIDSTYETINVEAKNSMLIILNLDNSKLESSINNNDKQSVMNDLNTINEVVNSLQKELALKNYSVDSNMFVLVKTEFDKKFVNVLKSVRPVIELSYSKLVDLYNEHAKKMDVSAVEPVVTPAVESVATPAVEPAATPTVESVATPAVEPTVTPTVEPVATPVVEPVATPTVEPVATPVVEPVATPTAEPVVENSKVKVKKLNKGGYVNIVILTAVLIGVTIFSVELGKFLFSIYG